MDDWSALDKAWRPWSPQQVSQRLADCAPWQIAGGWAIELYLGHPVRPHHDIEIAVPRQFFPAVRERLIGVSLGLAHDGRVEPLADGEAPPPDRRQCWVSQGGAFRLDIMLEEGDADTWVYRRRPVITAPRAELTLWRDGLPYLAPQAVLLFKSKNTRPQDESDFAACLPHLSAQARAWLAGALERVEPGHDWLKRF